MIMIITGTFGMAQHGGTEKSAVSKRGGGGGEVHYRSARPKSSMPAPAPPSSLV